MKRVLILPLLLVLVSCSTVDNDPKEEITSENLVLRTDKTSYTATIREDLPPVFYGFSLVAHFENNTDQTLYLNRCDADSPNPSYVIKYFKSESSQNPSHNISFACPGKHYPIVIKPGSLRIDTLTIITPKTSNDERKEMIDIFEGTSQLVYDIWTCQTGDGCDLPDSLSESNEFDVFLAD